MAETGIVFACIAPHGTMVVPPLSDDAGGAMQTRNALLEVGRRCAAAKPDVIVVATPHGMRVDNTICLAAGARGIGTLNYGGRSIDFNVPIDIDFTDLLAEKASARDVPIALASYAGNRRDQSANPLEWGTMTPLWFLGFDYDMADSADPMAREPKDQGPSIAVAAPSRLLPRQKMVDFGKAVADAAVASGKRVAFLASCDWGHTHQESGPYGYDPAAKEADGMVVQALKDNDPGRLIDLDDGLVQRAAMDGLWQTLMLAGVMQVTPLKGDFLSYEVPSYFGMMVAAFEPA